MYAPNYRDTAFQTIRDQEIGRVTAGRPGLISGLFGLGSDNAGEALVSTKLDTLNEKWQALTSTIFYSDYAGLQTLVNQLKLVATDVSQLIDEPKRSTILKVLNDGIAKQQKYIDEEISINRAKNTYTAMRNTIKGMLALPAGAAMPAAAPAVDLKKLILPAAITAGVATVVGIMLKKAF